MACCSARADRAARSPRQSDGAIVIHGVEVPVVCRSPYEFSLNRASSRLATTFAASACVTASGAVQSTSITSIERAEKLALVEGLLARGHVAMGSTTRPRSL